METTKAAEQLQQQPEKEKEKEQKQWRGVVEARLPSTPAAAAWPHIASFCALDRYLPGVVDVCELVAGEDGLPGCVRYTASLGADGEVAKWAREELLELDAAARRLAYAIIASNWGFDRYAATMTVVAADEEDETAGCRLVWAFECDPVQGWSLDGLLGVLDGGAKDIAKRIEEAEAAKKDAAGGDAAGAGAA